MPMQQTTQDFIDEIRTPTVANMVNIRTELRNFTATVNLLSQQIAKWDQMGKLAELDENNAAVDGQIETGMQMILGMAHTMRDLQEYVRRIRVQYRKLRDWDDDFEAAMIDILGV